MESLQGGDFACGDIVVFFAAITVNPAATDNNTVQLDFDFLGQPTSAAGVGFVNIVSASANVGDPAHVTDGDEAVSILTQAGGHPDGDLNGTIEITNLGVGDRQFILRLEVRLGCTPGQTPTGNLQAALDAGRVTSPAPSKINTGRQTIPFKQIGNIGGITALAGADLELTKTASPSPVVPGSDETYSLVVKNNGPSTATNVVVSDQLPSETTYVSASPGCTHASGKVTCTAASLAPGASITFTITVKLASSLAHCPRNTATVTSSTPDPNPSNNTSTVCPPLRPKADLAITKTPSSATMPPGGQVMYTLVVHDNGPSDATGVTVTDSPAAGLTLVSAHPSQGSCTLSTATCSLGTIVSGGSAQILVTADVSSTASGTLSNTASVSGDQQDPNTSNNSADATITVTPQTQPTSDIAIVEKVDHGTGYPGQKLTYTETVTDHGPSPASETKIIDTSSLPLNVLEAKPSQGTCHVGRTTTCSLGTLANGAHATIKIVAEVLRAGDENNSASSTSTSRDPHPTNNLDSARTTITPILRLNKTASPRTVNTGGTVTYHLKLTNPNSIAVHNVKLCDRLPLGLAYVSSRPKAKLSNGRRCWNFKSLRAHNSKVVEVVARALPGASGNLTNDATVTADGARTARARSRVHVNPSPSPPTPVTG